MSGGDSTHALNLICGLREARNEHDTLPAQRKVQWPCIGAKFAHLASASTSPEIQEFSEILGIFKDRKSTFRE